MIAQQNHTVEERLRSLFALQSIDTQRDALRIMQGELPIEVNDLEDELAGLNTRLAKSEKDLKEIDSKIGQLKAGIKEAEALIKRYEEQQTMVKNNREFESLMKEIEFQGLEIQLFTKRIKEQKAAYDMKHQSLDNAKSIIASKEKALASKKAELNEILTKTSSEEKELLEKSDLASKGIEERLLVAYNRIRKNFKNGLAVVTIERESCGGCFNHIPPQRRIDIRQRKKITLCEHCGRILVDEEIAGRDVEASGMEED